MIWINIISLALFTVSFLKHLSTVSKLDSYDRRNINIECEEIKVTLYLIASIIFGIMTFIDYSSMIK